MKRLLSLVLLAAVLLTLGVSLVSCGEKAECSLCGEEYPVKDMMKETDFGEVYYFCPECNENIGDIEDILD